MGMRNAREANVGELHVAEHGLRLSLAAALHEPRQCLQRLDAAGGLFDQTIPIPPRATIPQPPFFRLSGQISRFHVPLPISRMNSTTFSAPGRKRGAENVWRGEVYTRVAVCGTNGSILNHAIARMNHKLAHHLPSRAPAEPTIEMISRFHTRTVRGVPKGSSDLHTYLHARQQTLVQVHQPVERVADGASQLDHARQLARSQLPQVNQPRAVRQPHRHPCVVGRWHTHTQSNA